MGKALTLLQYTLEAPMRYAVVNEIDNECQ
jgi:hypothetical protein